MLLTAIKAINTIVAYIRNFSSPLLCLKVSPPEVRPPNVGDKPTPLICNMIEIIKSTDKIICKYEINLIIVFNNNTCEF